VIQQHGDPHVTAVTRGYRKLVGPTWPVCRLIGEVPSWPAVILVATGPPHRQFIASVLPLRVFAPMGPGMPRAIARSYLVSAFQRSFRRWKKLRGAGGAIGAALAAAATAEAVGGV
jgi:hypothetical protein